MEEEKKLYPFTFCSLQDEYPWGTEEFKLADLGYRDSLVRSGWLGGNSLSEVMDTYLDRVVGEDLYNWYGRQFPLCVRHLHVHGRMPLRVHPDDETAEQRYDFLGKEKLWYVLRAGKDARLMVGFRRDTDASEFYARCQDGSVDQILGIIAPHAGQCLYIPAGTPHAAAGDLEILEIAESSPMDFCLCDWGEGVHPDEFDPALTLADALDFINYHHFVAALPAGDRLLDSARMRVERLHLTAPLAISQEEGASFVLYCCVHGAAAVQLSLEGGGQLDFPLREGETMLVPAECSSYRLLPLERDTLLLEATARYTETDPYINPDAEPVLPEDL